MKLETQSVDRPEGPSQEGEGISLPTVAVCIAGRNAVDYVEEMLESLSRQKRLPDEIIFFDDGSTDGTFDVVSAWQEKLPMLTVTRGEEPGGISRARNNANELVRSGYIAVLDADDLLHPEAIEQYVRFFAENPEVDLAYGDTVVFREYPEFGKLRRYPSFASRREAIRSVLGSPLVPIKHSSIAYRRQAIEDIGGYEESFPIKVDIELFLRFLAEDKVVRKLDRAISFHRKHDGQISTRRREGLRAYRRLLLTYEPNRLVRAGLSFARHASELLKRILKG